MFLASCADDLQSTPPERTTTSSTMTTEVLHDGLAGPTQFVIDNDDFIVALINGDENGETGQVVRVDHETDRRTVLLDGLDKPTGVALLGGELWVMERDRLTRGVIGSERSVIADDLPSNGRSQGTLTVTPSGTILFNTSGRRRGADVVEGSGRIFEVDPATNEVTEVASGFKHAYAHTYTGETLWSVEMSDGTFDGAPAADELVAVQAGVDHGWPHCVGDRRTVAEFAGTKSACEQTPPSQAVFAPSATPTSIVASPFSDDQLLVALWRENEIVSVSALLDDGVRTTVTVVAELDNPQHLVVPAETPGEDPVVYLTEFGTGSIIAISD